MILLAICAGGVAALTIYAHWHRGVFRKMGVPSAPTVPFIGSLHTYFWINNAFDANTYHLQRFGAKDGKFVGIFDGRQPILLIADPEMIRSVLQKQWPEFCDRQTFVFGEDNANLLRLSLFNLNGTHWNRVRQLLTPAFTSSNLLRRWIPLIAECANYLIEDIKNRSYKSAAVNIRNVSCRFSLRAIASIAFGIDLRRGGTEDKFLKTAFETFDDSNWLISILTLAFPHIVNLILIALNAVGLRTNSVENIDILANFVYEEIERRRRGNFTRDDFLQSLIALETTESKTDDAKLKQNASMTFSNLLLFVTCLERNGLSRDEIVAQCLLFLTSGYETIASTLTGFCVSMADNLDCQNRLREELSNCELSGDTEITYERLSTLTYLDMCLLETMRIYPAVSRIDRVCTAKAGSTVGAIKIPHGLTVGIPIAAMNTMTEFWQNPKRFDPRRFINGIPEALAFTFLPFGAGSRNCIGERLAKLKLRVAIVAIFRKYRVELSQHTKLPVKMSATGLRGQVEPVYLRFVESPIH